MMETITRVNNAENEEKCPEIPLLKGKSSFIIRLAFIHIIIYFYALSRTLKINRHLIIKKKKAQKAPPQDLLHLLEYPACSPLALNGKSRGT